MIELERATYSWIAEDEELWEDAGQDHVISREDGRFYLRDETGELGSYPTLAAAFDYLQTSQVWGEVSLGPANRLRENIETGRADEIGHFLLEYLADYGEVGIDAKELAGRVFARVGADDEAWQ